MNVKDWTVCIIEPNKFEGQIIVDLLKNAGVDKVKLFTSQDAALDVLEVYNANIVIAAFEMQPMDGATWTKAYRRNMKLPGRKQAIFVTSGAFSRSMAEECRHAGANALIGKPISGKVLLATINKVLGSPREFIDAPGYVGPCRRAGIVTAGAPKKRRKADDTPAAGGAKPVITIEIAIQALSAAASQYAADPRKQDGCEAALRLVQSYAVNASDGPLMRACAAFGLQMGLPKNVKPEAARAALDACITGIVQLVAMPVEQTAERDAIAETIRASVAKAAAARAAA